MRAAFVCRLWALGLGLSAMGLAAGGLACSPPVLEGWILASGRLASGLTKFLAYAAALLLVLAALACARRAIRSWRAPDRSPKEIGFALVAVVLSCAIALVGAELVARAVLAPEEVLSGDAYYRYVWIEGAKKADASPGGVNPRHPTDRYDPGLGWVPAANYRSERLNVNARGLRGRREHPPVKERGEKRIVVTGDSFTFGENVADDEVYTEVLDEILENTRVVNLGVHGYGTDQQYLRLKSIGFEYDPDLVILAYYKANADRNVLSFRDYAKPWFRLAEGRLELENVPVPAPSDLKAAGDPPGPRSYLYGLARKNLRKAMAHTRFAPQWELTTAILDAALDATRKHGVPFMVVYIPAARPRLSEVPEAAETVVSDWAERRDVPLLNLRLEFLRLSAADQARLYRGHWTAEGHRQAAGLIARFIEE